MSLNLKQSLPFISEIFIKKGKTINYSSAKTSAILYEPLTLLRKIEK